MNVSSSAYSVRASRAPFAWQVRTRLARAGWLAFVMLVVTAGMVSLAAAQTTPIAGPIAASGHGALFDVDGREIIADANFILRAQRVYLDRLLERSPRRIEQSLSIMRLRASNLSLADQSTLNAESIAALIDQVNPSNAPHLRVVNGALRTKFAQLEAARLGQPRTWGTRIRPSASLARELVRAGLKQDAGTPNFVTILAGKAYVDECRNRGVPIPPAWGSGQWQNRGRLATKFIITELEAEVWTFESSSPRGICIALPRFRSGTNSSSAFGIICQGNDSSKACFWDNRGDIPLTGTTPLLPAWKGGVELVGGNGICTDCHAGDNPFIVHPGSPLDRGAALVPNSWVDPIVDAGWPQNSGPTKLLDNIALGANERSCLDCHNSPGRRFPEISTDLPGYCVKVLAGAYRAGGTMPLGNPGDPAYKKHAEALLAACSVPPKPKEPPPHTAPVACSVFDDGYMNMTGASEAIYLAGNQKACIPDGTPMGTCRKWFGRCRVLSDNQAVTMRVFNDGASASTGLSDAIFKAGPESACIPSATGAGNCRKWFGLGETADRHAVECFLFNDGLTDWVGPTNAIFFNASDQVCMPDGGPGTCRRWFGNCQVGAALPPLPQPSKEMSAAASPQPMPVRRPVQVKVTTTDVITGQPVAARIEINGQVVANSNTTFTFTFTPKRVGTGQNAEVVYPVGIARASGYQAIQIDFGFPN